MATSTGCARNWRTASASVAANPIISTLPGSERKSLRRSRTDGESSTRKTRRHRPSGLRAFGSVRREAADRPAPDPEATRY